MKKKVALWAILSFSMILYPENTMIQNQQTDVRVAAQARTQTYSAPTAQKIQEWSEWSSRIHKLRLGVGVSLTALTALYSFIFYSEYKIHHHTWARFKEAIPLSALKEIPPKDILNELIKLQGGSHPIQSLLFILQDIEHEYNRLHRYMRLHTLSFLFLLPHQRELKNKVYEQLIRLDFLKHIILNNIAISE